LTRGIKPGAFGYKGCAIPQAQETRIKEIFFGVDGFWDSGYFNSATGIDNYGGEKSAASYYVRLFSVVSMDS
jgi:hypothetical protein